MNHTLETTLEENRLGSFLKRKSNANDILVIGSRVLKHQI